MISLNIFCHFSPKVATLSRERSDLDKRLMAKEDDVKRLDGRLLQIQKDKTTLQAKVASLDKQLLDLQKSNDLLKNKVITQSINKPCDEYLSLHQILL